ncbi:sugar phosphate isomerase/epimerase [Neolewinella xylanilytica]|uniref:Sugar phosphate isomerase/epimerase n=1 Tax=Neolewinella xylanilytica TaxID=1514080 RepID=A0A2S6I983_9BACT|nr:sugar phosphate isomerase/epimerase family protein [Neolewinella xylanilytica]PPK88053.1 sugar phosphate isomerase/epimerase [Neolewinella xylanilytica]
MKMTCLTFAALLLSPFLSAQEAPTIPAIGIVQDSLENDAVITAAGYGYLTASTQLLLSPRNVSEAEFQALLPGIRALEVPLYATNLFLPGELKVVGPDVDEAAVIGYVDTVLRRAQEAGLTLITWGSCGSRSLPDGFSRIEAAAQFVYMGKRVAEVAERYDMILALENLNTTECNFITTLREALEVVRAVDHPNFRLCVDIYHMLMNGEPASDIRGVGPYAVYSEIAEREHRAPPGVAGDDFTPYLRALKAEGYTGNIHIEARWGEVGEQGKPAYEEMMRQVREAYE